MAAAAAAGGEWCGVGFKWGNEERWSGLKWEGFFWWTPDWAPSGERPRSIQLAPAQIGHFDGPCSFYATIISCPSPISSLYKLTKLKLNSHSSSLKKNSHSSSYFLCKKIISQKKYPKVLLKKN
jgi:hypothetical protein